MKKTNHEKIVAKVVLDFNLRHETAIELVSNEDEFNLFVTRQLMHINGLSACKLRSE